MPNHVTNHLTVNGETDDLLSFYAGLKREMHPHTGETTIGILNGHYPCPKELMSTPAMPGNQDPEYTKQLVVNDAIYGNITWYDWCIEHWGTKWSDYETHIVSPELRYGNKMLYYNGDIHLYHFEIEFLSAWSPPIEGLRHVSEKFPALEFMLKYWDEDRWGFFGRCRIENGAITHRQEFRNLANP